VIKKWLKLKKIPHLGNAGIKKLWDCFGSIDDIWSADTFVLDKIEGLSKKAIKSFIENRDKININDVKIPDDINILAFDSENYPKNLLNIHDPPSIIYVKGSVLPQDDKSIAIVGTRNATRYGIDMAKKFAYELSKLGITIVSGMALGIDTAAHEGAILAKGRTIAVLGCGPDIIYPPENKDLRNSIISSGCIFSEYPPKDPPENWKFPSRNRIISGLSLGTIVIEGGYESGAMITAKQALEQGREVFALPGNIESKSSKGPHWLIQQGAKLVENVEDILEELENVINVGTRLIASVPPIIDYSRFPIDEQTILKIIISDPVHIDEITAKSGMEISKTLSIISKLEILGLIKQLPGKYFVKR